MTPTLRAATLDDLDPLANFAEAMARETENKVLDVPTVRSGIRAVLNDPDKGFYLVAEHDGRVVGALMITTEWSDWRNGLFWWIQSVYVRPAARRQGVYSTLHQHVRQMARVEEDVCGLRLYVDAENRTAQHTYEHLEMEPTRYRMYEVVFGENDAAGEGGP